MILRQAFCLTLISFIPKSTAIFGSNDGFKDFNWFNSGWDDNLNSLLGQWGGATTEQTTTEEPNPFADFPSLPEFSLQESDDVQEVEVEGDQELSGVFLGLDCGKTFFDFFSKKIFFEIFSKNFYQPQAP